LKSPYNAKKEISKLHLKGYDSLEKTNTFLTLTNRPAKEVEIFKYGFDLMGFYGGYLKSVYHEPRP